MKNIKSPERELLGKNKRVYARLIYIYSQLKCKHNNYFTSSKCRLYDAINNTSHYKANL